MFLLLVVSISFIISPIVAQLSQFNRSNTNTVIHLLPNLNNTSIKSPLFPVVHHIPQLSIESVQDINGNFITDGGVLFADGGDDIGGSALYRDNCPDPNDPFAVYGTSTNTAFMKCPSFAGYRTDFIKHIPFKTPIIPTIKINARDGLKFIMCSVDDIPAFGNLCNRDVNLLPFNIKNPSTLSLIPPDDFFRKQKLPEDWTGFGFGPHTLKIELVDKNGFHSAPATWTWVTNCPGIKSIDRTPSYFESLICDIPDSGWGAYFRHG